MKVEATWQGRAAFGAKMGQHELVMDTKPPISGDAGPSPKQLYLAAICGCTGIDVALHLRKKKVEAELLRITANAEQTETTPAVFKAIELLFECNGATVDPKVVAEAVLLSQTKYCGVSAMAAKHCAINYQVVVNGQEVSRGSANFSGT
jgi:putative redox protein